MIVQPSSSRVNSVMDLYCCWLLSCQLMPRITIFLLCLPEQFKISATEGWQKGEMVQHSRLCELHSCTLCREVSRQSRCHGGALVDLAPPKLKYETLVSHRGLFAKIPNLVLAPELIFFQSLPKIQTIGEDRNKDRFKNWQLCGVWKLRFVTTER